MWHLARRGFSLFTLIINIRDNAYPLSRSWNSSSDTRIGSMTYCSYHMRKSVYQYISLFFVTMFLLARLSFVANSPLNEVFTFTLPCLSTASRTRSKATFSASSKNRRGSMWLEFITAFVNIRFSRRRSLASQEIVHCYSRIRHEMCRSIAILHPWVARSSPPQIVCVQRRGADAWHEKVLRVAQCTYRIHLLQPCETLHQSSDLAALLQQFAFHSLFHVFSVFRSRRTLSRSTCTWLIHIRCNIVTYLE